MTTEEKARAYDEALKDMRAIYPNLKGDAKLAVEHAFPELRESEDERIRKRLLWFLANYNGRWDYPETRMACRAWLEKQEDASKAIEAVDRIDKYIDEHLANAHDMKDSNPDKKYYRGWDDALGKMAGILQDVYSGEKQKEPENVSASTMIPSCWEVKQKEQKPEGVYVDCTEHPEWYGMPKKPHRVCLDTVEAIDKVRELDEQMEKEQKPAWSEEDEEIAHTILNLPCSQVTYVTGQGTTSGKQFITYAKERDWFEKRFKSLRPQTHWRPSEEQMDALAKAVTLYGSGLDSLYQDLKKLI